jgi:hypothetical protein
MVIVIATRVDLRHESVMADEAFALSPISARAVQPSEADYDAIREAFMETSRGRWFLGEFAKRNRNADTSMVLDAVSRIEETLAAHRQPPAPDDRLAEALAAIRGAVNRAAETAAATFDSAALEAHLAPIRIGTRIIKEISWRWREIGADGRICDLIDSQIDAIEAGCGQIAELDRRAALSAAFDLIKTSIEGFADSDDTAPPAAEDAIVTATPPASDRMAQPDEADDDAINSDIALAEPVEPEAPAPEALGTDDAEAVIEEALAQEALAQEALADEALADEVLAEEALTEESLAEPAFIEADIIEAATGPTEMPPDEAAETVEAVELQAVELAADAQPKAQADAQSDAHDEAVLELVAAEMAAPDPAEIDGYYDHPLGDDIIVTTRSVEAVSPARMLEVVAAPVRPPIVQPFAQSSPPVSFQPSPAVAREPSPGPAIEPSLGSTIIANGLLQPAKVPANDPLAPIRRMSQAEKIALFS